MKDLYHNQPGYEYVELLEDCELYAIRIDELNQIYETNIEIANWGRYEQLLREQPDVIHRAQLGYIASFLGMTPQHLSRLRSES